MENQLIIGRNSLREALRSSKNIDKILISNENPRGSLRDIILEAKANNILIKNVDKHKLDSISNFANHQGVVAYINDFAYSSVDDILGNAQKSHKPPFIIVLDCIEDSGNLGAIIRTAECAAAHGIIVPKRRCAPLNFIANKASAGAINNMPIARVTNIARTLDYLKKQNIWIFAADMQGCNYKQVDFKGPLALVFGNEGSGISRLVKETCDAVVSIPMKGKISSLNVSVSAGILMYEVLSQRNN